MSTDCSQYAACPESCVYNYMWSTISENIEYVCEGLVCSLFAQSSNKQEQVKKIMILT